MRAYIPGYELDAPRTLGEALGRLAAEPGRWRPFAGGTDLMVLLEAGKLDHRRFLSIWRLNELQGIEFAAEWVTLGCLTTYTDVLRHDRLRREFPMLAAAAAETGGVATQNRGTLGGNIANASPAADTPPALLAYDAEVELVSARGARWLPYREFHTGYKTMQLQPDELLARIRLPRSTTRFKHYYRKVGTRKAQAISKVCFAGVKNDATGEVRIALGSVAPVPLRCSKTEAAIREGRDAVAALASEIAPIGDTRSTAAYRLRVGQNLLQEFLHA
ncbi:MAG TPA: FAD binding domain-containing protein [Terriglobia bacterium]|nr:FAD binding domain-containing protein [Terriglobia bacterium]